MWCIFRHTRDNSLFILRKLWVYYTASNRDEKSKMKGRNEALTSTPNLVQNLKLGNRNWQVHTDYVGTPHFSLSDTKRGIPLKLDSHFANPRHGRFLFSNVGKYRPLTRRHIPDDCHLQQHRCENLKSRTAQDTHQVFILYFCHACTGLCHEYQNRGQPISKQNCKKGTVVFVQRRLVLYI